MTPTVLLTDDDESLAVLNPHKPGVFSLTGLDPRTVRFREDRLDRAMRSDEQKVSLVAEATELLDEHFVGVARPFDLPQIHSFLGAFDGQPCQLRPVGIHDTDSQLLNLSTHS